MSTVLHPGDPVYLTATPKGVDLAATHPTITWASNNTNVMTITDHGDGTATGHAVTPGTAEVTATATDPDGHTTESEPDPIIVEPEDTSSVSITASTTAPTSAGTAVASSPPTSTPAATSGSATPPPSTTTTPSTP